MNETNNIVKETCETLGVKFRELAEIMGVNEGTPAQWSSKGNIPENMQKFMQLLIEHKQDKDQLDKLKNAVQIFKEIA